LLFAYYPSFLEGRGQVEKRGKREKKKERKKGGTACARMYSPLKSRWKRERRERERGREEKKRRRSQEVINPSP